ncbi:nuclear transport factor 2 family protein [Palleronia pelagia]|uniref:SnoaL-like domain-containing protein n=1 Tax=Palleronia pelagia TaxID=387096 RepID=A0A1H8JHF4_9RHOB|nr:nuclear transport factor 2 family protein [Palleronia pelagia]SEN79875.1 SnoaL-like domain-containing protein [Palleronia pelagia]
MSFQAEKALVLDHYDALSRATPETVAEILSERTAPDWLWRGVRPFESRCGARDVAETLWQPLLTAMPRLQRRPDIFFAGHSDRATGGVWVVQMGHLMGLLDQPFLTIPASRKIAMLRYAEFNRVENGRITETAFFCDLLHLARQAGLNPLPQQTAQHLVQPGPLTHDGLLYRDADPAEGRETLDLIERMIGDINTRARFETPEQELAQTWHDDMIWWGPEGIGATYTIPRYIEQHQRPFRTHLSDRVFNGHVARLAEGSYGGFFGWPNLSLTNSGAFMGVPGDGVTRADMRVVDIYRRAGDRLAENWIFIDMPHFLAMQGVDVLGLDALVPTV